MIHLMILATLAAFIQYGGCCDTGRIFIGSINETYPDQVDKNGVYVRMTSLLNGLPVYKHESRDYYLYHVRGNIISPHWLVGPDPGSLEATLSLQTATPDVERASEQWQVWSGADRKWISQKHMKAVCVDASFVTCKTGKILLAGLSPWNHRQLNRTGFFYLTNRTHEMRPVYKSEHQRDYLFYVDGLWIVGPEVGRVAAGLFVLDYAWRPEYIIASWIVFNGKQFLREPKLRITCAGSGASVFSLGGHHHDEDELEEQEEGEDIGADDMVMIAEGILHDGEPLLPICGRSYCENGGTCIKNEVDDFLCACPESYFGARCEKSVDCGVPPPIQNGEVVSQSGSGFHALAFYACVDHHFLQGVSVVSCEEDGVWSEPPSCVDWLDFVNPGVIPTPARTSGSQPTIRRRSRHRRTRRGGLPLTVNTLKAMFN